MAMTLPYTWLSSPSRAPRWVERRGSTKEGARARPVSIATFQSNLVRVAGDMSLPEPLTTHRLRHSFATSLMNGGMSLMGIMKLLGHRDQRMTMRYAQIADETVGREYFEALSRVSERYVTIGAATEVVSDPLELLQNVIRWLAKELCVGRTERHARLLIRRLEAARDDLDALRSEAGTPRVRARDVAVDSGRSRSGPEKWAT